MTKREAPFRAWTLVHRLLSEAKHVSASKTHTFYSNRKKVSNTEHRGACWKRKQEIH